LQYKLEDPKIKYVVDTFNRGIPVVAFPNIQRCLGMENKDAVMEIKDGYAIMGYDYDVTKSNSDCLFNMKENLKEKELREAKRNIKEFGLNAETFQKFGQVADMFSKQVDKLKKAGGDRPPIDVNNIMNTLGAKRDELFEGLKNGENIKKMMKDNEAELLKYQDQIKNVGQGLFNFFQK